jgi:exodeoxyribonuclease VII large subunit
MPSIFSTDSIFSVSQLNNKAKSLLEQELSYIQVIGEISNLSRPASGHLYFSLKDEHAQVRCALFKRQAQRLNFTPENGLQILVNANTSLYEARGDYQLIINNAQETGDGALHKAFEKLKEKLAAKGLFSAEHKKELPTIPQAIGIITSPTGAAIQDILSVLKRRFPSIPVIIYPVMVQGTEAKYQINQALITANQRKECDVIILARGGGSLEDLWAFNEEMVAKAIFKSRIPIISGIGHETDTTIADYVADFRAATPTAAAEHATPDVQHWKNQFSAYQQHLTQLMQNKLMERARHLDWLNKNLNQQHPGKQLKLKFLRLADLNSRLRNHLHNHLTQSKNQLTIQQAELMQFNPAYKVQQLKSKFTLLTNRLHNNIETQLQKNKSQLQLLSSTLNIVSPLSTLERGYTLTSTEKGKLIHSSQNLKIGDNIKTRFAKSTITSQIQSINHD